MKDPKKIVLFTSALGFGGTENVVYHLFYELQKYYDVSLVFMYHGTGFELKPDDQVFYLSDENVDIKTGVLPRTFDFLRFSKSYVKLLKDIKPDIAISFLAFPNVINSIAKKRIKNLKTIISERCFPTLVYDTGALQLFTKKSIIKLFYNHNDHLFSNSIYINKDLVEHFNLKIPHSVVYNPLIIEHKNPQLKAHSKAEFKVMNVGRLEDQKNQTPLIQAFSKLPKNYTLSIYGKGSLKENLTILISDLDAIRQISLKGTVSDIQLEMQKYHCLILFSLSEGFPNVLLEAMASKLPIISANCPSGPLEMLNDNEPVTIKEGEFYEAKYGLLVNVNDKIAVNKAVEYYANNPDIRAMYSEAAFTKAQSFGLEEIGLNTKQLIDLVL